MLNLKKQRIIFYQSLYSPSQVKKACEEYAVVKIKKALNIYNNVIALSCKDKLKFSNKKTKQFLQHILTMFDDVNKGLISFEDIRNTVIEELKIDYN